MYWSPYSIAVNNNTWLFSFDGTWIAEFDYQLTNPLDSLYRLSRKESSTYELFGNRYTITWSKEQGLLTFWATHLHLDNTHLDAPFPAD